MRHLASMIYYLHHYDLMTDTCVNELNYHFVIHYPLFRSVPSHCLNQRWPILDWTFLNKHFIEMGIKIQDFSVIKTILEMSSAKWRPKSGKCGKCGKKAAPHRVRVANLHTKFQPQTVMSQWIWISHDATMLWCGECCARVGIKGRDK